MSSDLAYWRAVVALRKRGYRVYRALKHPKSAFLDGRLVSREDIERIAREEAECAA